MAYSVNCQTSKMKRLLIAREASHQLPCLPSGIVSPCNPGVIEGSEDAWGAVNL